MRLGGFFRANTIDALEPLCEKLDRHGLSAIPAPATGQSMSDDDAAAFGDKARTLDMVVGEWGFWSNLMIHDSAERDHRIGQLRVILKKADVMGVPCVMSLVGTRDASDHPLAPHPYMFTEACQTEFREVVLRILDGLDLTSTHYAIEPWCNTFFYQPEDILPFIERVDHPRFGLHLDQMNMVSFKDFYHTIDLINRTFNLLKEFVCSVHLKDIRWDFEHMFLKWDEVYVGDGVMDYATYLKQIAKLPADIPCYCEHMSEERDYALNFARLHELAEKAGVTFLRRRRDEKKRRSDPNRRTTK